MFDAYGADAMRWMLLSSPILRGADFSDTETGIRDTVRHVVLPYWNAYYVLTLYATAAEATRSWASRDMRTTPSAVALRSLTGLPPTSTMRARPASSRWVSFTGSPPAPRPARRG